LNSLLLDSSFSHFFLEKKMKDLEEDLKVKRDV